jgi:hypothetical protein
MLLLHECQIDHVLLREVYTNRNWGSSGAPARQRLRLFRWAGPQRPSVINRRMGHVALVHLNLECVQDNRRVSLPGIVGHSPRALDREHVEVTTRRVHAQRCEHRVAFCAALRSSSLVMPLPGTGRFRPVPLCHEPLPKPTTVDTGRFAGQPRAWWSVLGIVPEQKRRGVTTAD